MRESARISTVLQDWLEAKHQRLEARKAVVGPMGYCRAASVLVALMLISLALPAAYGDTVISSEEVEILEAGSFQIPSEWSFETTTGFSTDQAEYTIGMVADGEMSFTHARPDNFAEYTSWG